MSDKREDRGLRPLSERMTSFTPMNTPLKQVLMKVRDNLALRWPDELKSDPNNRLRTKYYRFHRDHGHDMFDCYDLKQQIEVLIK